MHQRHDRAQGQFLCRVRSPRPHAGASPDARGRGSTAPLPSRSLPKPPLMARHTHLHAGRHPSRPSGAPIVRQRHSSRHLRTTQTPATRWPLAWHAERGSSATTASGGPPMPRFRSGRPDNRSSLASLLPSSAVGLMNGVASQRFAGLTCAAEQKQPCSLEQDSVSCSSDDVVIERAGVAHRLILLLRSDVGGRSDPRRCREVLP